VCSSDLGSENKLIVFVGTKKEVKGLIKKAASALNMPYVAERWLGGTLTNFKEIKGRLDHLNGLVQKRDSGELEKYTKKERLQIGKEIIKMERFFKSLQGVVAKPAALVVVDSDYEKNAVDEAKVISVPVVALMNSDCNPEGINFSVPGSDSSLSSVEYFLTEIVKAYKDGASNVEQVIKEKEINIKNDNNGTN
jgi:small subunit ribosomal protein S2